MRWVVMAFVGLLSYSAVFAVEPGNNPTFKVSDVRDLVSLKTEVNSELNSLERFNGVLSQLQKRQTQYKHESDFIEYLYYFTHRKLLRQYVQYPTLEETLQNGAYDCLTATAVYSLLFSELSIQHAVVETNYHIYILVNPDTPNEILIETTDPRNGFVTDTKEIESDKIKYLEENSDKRNTQIQFNFNIARRLQGKELIGLLYYNQSIKALNEGRWVDAQKNSDIAYEFYPYERVSTLIDILDGNYSTASL